MCDKSSENARLFVNGYLKYNVCCAVASRLNYQGGPHSDRGSQSCSEVTGLKLSLRVNYFNEVVLIWSLFLLSDRYRFLMETLANRLKIESQITFYLNNTLKKQKPE